MMYSLRAELRNISDFGSSIFHRFSLFDTSRNSFISEGLLSKCIFANDPLVVNISSIQGVMGFAGAGAYSASKHGVIGLTRSAAKEVGDREVRVNAVAPGAILTPLLKKAQEVNPNEGHGNPTAIKRQGTAEEMANIICFLLGPESTYVTGSVYGGDGGWNC